MAQCDHYECQNHRPGGNWGWQACRHKGYDDRIKYLTKELERTRKLLTEYMDTCYSKEIELRRVKETWFNPLTPS